MLKILPTCQVSHIINLCPFLPKSSSEGDAQKGSIFLQVSL